MTHPPITVREQASERMSHCQETVKAFLRTYGGDDKRNIAHLVTAQVAATIEVKTENRWYTLDELINPVEESLDVVYDQLQSEIDQATEVEVYQL